MKLAFRMVDAATVCNGRCEGRVHILSPFFGLREEPFFVSHRNVANGPFGGVGSNLASSICSLPHFLASRAVDRLFNDPSPADLF